MIDYASNTIANIIDPTGTGSPWWEDARKYWSAWGGNILAGGSTKELEDPCGSLAEKGWPYCFRMKTWNVSVPEDQTNTDDMGEYFKQSKAKLIEEIFRMYTERVLGALIPEKFGSNWGSAMCKEVSKLECMKPGW